MDSGITASQTASALPALVFRDVSFSYPTEGGYDTPVLNHASIEVPTGTFAILVGATGSGKTTALRLAKREVTPAGDLQGTVEVFGQNVADLSVGDSCQLVGYVFQSPDNQIVCDTVWHELAFGLENLGLPQTEMCRRLSETCVFLGIERLLHQRCEELSGGQRQVVALAAVLAMRPRLLLLDEPTAMLDPVAQKEFLSLLFRANRELGITVVVATHDPASMVDYATDGFILKDGTFATAQLGELVTQPNLGFPTEQPSLTARLTLLSDAWVRYARNEPWVLRGCDLAVAPGEIRALVGGNGSGKSTLLNATAGVLRLQRGRLHNPLRSHQALLPQQPKAVLGCETVLEELGEWSRIAGYDATEIEATLERLGMGDRRHVHPYDLSGGQQQLLALEKLLLTKPKLLLLDEPTKGLDATSRRAIAQRVRDLAESGCAVIIATHDLAFVQATAHSVTLLFDGQTGEPETTSDFFARSWMWRP